MCISLKRLTSTDVCRGEVAINWRHPTHYWWNGRVGVGLRRSVVFRAHKDRRMTLKPIWSFFTSPPFFNKQFYLWQFKGGQHESRVKYVGVTLFNLNFKIHIDILTEKGFWQVK